jgi:hypothetical protein
LGDYEEAERTHIKKAKKKGESVLIREIQN